MKRLFSIIIFVVLLIPIFSFAEGTAQKGIPVSSYLFHLYYDNGKLVPDRDSKFTYDLIFEQFVQPAIVPSKSFKGEVVNAKGENIASFYFDPQNGDSSFTKRKILIKGPYVADAARVDFFNVRGVKLLSVSVKESSICNDNGICNKEIGETAENCPVDCSARISLTVSPEITATISPSSPAQTTGGLNIARTIFYFIFGAAIVAILWFLRKQQKKEQGI